MPLTGFGEIKISLLLLTHRKKFVRFAAQKIISKILAQLLPAYTILPSVLLQQDFQYLFQKSSSTQPLSQTPFVLCRAEHPAASLFIFAGAVRGCLTFPDSFNTSEIG